MNTTMLKKSFVEVANVRETVPFTLLAGGMAFLNVLLMPTHAGFAFWIGGMIGALVFLRRWKIPRTRGVIYLVAFSVFSFMAYRSGVIEHFRIGVFG